MEEEENISYERLTRDISKDGMSGHRQTASEKSTLDGKLPRLVCGVRHADCVRAVW